jgi:hypothetical protein
MYPHLSYNYYNFYENHYMKRFQESPHSFPHQGFYKSIENNVINNPRVNNRSLRKIDRQQGNNIVRKPNAFETTSPAGGSAGSYSTGRTYNTHQGVNQSGAVVPGNIERQNTGTYGGSANPRQFNTVNPGRSEGNVNPGRFDSGSSPVRKAARDAQIQQYSRPPVQQYNPNRSAPAQQNTNRVAPAQQNNYRSAPVQQNNNRVAPSQPANSNAVREKAPAQSNSHADHSRKERDNGKER